MTAMLEVADVHTYYEHSHILHGVSMRAQAGAVTAILGRNGVGKTTLIRSILGISPPRAGTIAFAGERIHRLAVDEMARRALCVGRLRRCVCLRLTLCESSWKRMDAKNRKLVTTPTDQCCVRVHCGCWAVNCAPSDIVMRTKMITQLAWM